MTDDLRIGGESGAVTAEEKALLCYNSALSKKADGIVAFDVRSISDVADIFMVMGGSSGRQVKTIVDAVETALRAMGEKKYHIEGYDNATWVLIDAGDVIVHVFLEKTRRYYEIERLWADAETVKFPSEGPQENVEVV